MKLSKYLGDKPFWQVTLRLAVPIALQNLLTNSFALVDTLMVSRLGDVNLSAVGMAGQWTWFMNLLSWGLCGGMNVFVSQFWGVRDLKGIRRTFGMALLSCLLLSGLFLAVACIRPEFVLRLFNKDPAVVEAGCRYLRIACLSYPAVALTLVMSNLLRSTERVLLPLSVSAVTTVVNALVNYALIFGKFGMPELGVAGAAVGTCVSAWMGPVLIGLFSIKSGNLLTGPVKELFAFAGKHLKEFFRKAMPVVLNEGMWALGIITLNMIYANMGYEYYAGMTVFKTFGDLAFSFYAGLGSACVVMVGKSIGKGKIARGLEDALRFTVLVPLTGVVVGGLTILLRHPLISIFSTGDNLSATALQTALAVTVFCSAEISLRNMSYVQVVGVFRSGGDTTVGMLLDLGSIWLISIPAALVAAHVLHLPFFAVVVVAYLFEDIPKDIFCLLHFKSRKWLKPVTPEGKAGLEEYNKEKASR